MANRGSTAKNLRSVDEITETLTHAILDDAPYTRTLREWRQRFFGNLDAVRSLGYPESFVRLWEYYLCYCEGGFAERQLGDVQLLLTKPDCRLRPLAL